MTFGALAVLVALFAVVAGAQSVPVFNEDLSPVYFEAFNYPLKARLSHIEGVVVVRATLDDEGRVVASEAVAGPKALIEDCLLNAKKWLFKPNTSKRAVIVYLFRIEGLCQLPCPSQFSFRPPNIATIVIGDPVVDHSATPR